MVVAQKAHDRRAVPGLPASHIAELRSAPPAVRRTMTVATYYFGAFCHMPGRISSFVLHPPILLRHPRLNANAD